MKAVRGVSFKTVMSFVGTVSVVLALNGVLIGTASASGKVDRVAVVSQSGKKALVSGSLPKCPTGARRTVAVSLTQSGKTAKGTWRARCQGGIQAWSAVLKTSGARIASGPARVTALVVYRFGKQRTSRKIVRRVRLRTKAGNHPPGDRPIMVGVTFRLPAGYEVYVEGGGAGTKRSSCTRDETVELFTSDGGAKRILFHFIAKAGGGCSLLESYNQVWVAVDGPGTKDLGGYFWLGQKSSGHPYFASCKVRVENVFDSYDWINAWNGLRCTQPADWELEVTLP